MPDIATPLERALAGDVLAAALSSPDGTRQFPAGHPLSTDELLELARHGVTFILRRPQDGHAEAARARLAARFALAGDGRSTHALFALLMHYRVTTPDRTPNP